jgi:S1-C subfamily serine protease
MLVAMPLHRFAAQLLIVVVAALVVGVIWQSIPLIQAELLGWRSEPRAITPRGELAADEQATIELFETRKSSVVYISTSERVFDPWTRSVYDMPRGTGSGFLWDRLGHVITNAHVVAGASGAFVRLADGRVFPASLVGVDPSHDLAVLRIGVPTGRPEPLPIGASSDLKVGQKVFAIGNPFGLDWTLTTGIVSALERELPTETGTIRGLIQTDAAINPGNSGGPLLDSAGRLIGVNTAIYSPSGAYAGIGFAVPVDTVNRVVPQLIRRGHYAPPSLGVVTDSRADELARRQGIEGVLILRVQPGSAAARAGLQPARIGADGRLDPGDVIVGLDGAEIATTEELRAALDLRRAGDEVELQLLREGGVVTMNVTLDAGA